MDVLRKIVLIYVIIFRKYCIIDQSLSKSRQPLLSSDKNNVGGQALSEVVRN